MLFFIFLFCTSLQWFFSFFSFFFEKLVLDPKGGNQI